MLILRGSSVSIVTRLDGVMIGVLLPREQYFYFGHSFQTGCRIPPPPTHWLPGVILLWQVVVEFLRTARSKKRYFPDLVNPVCIKKI